MRSTRSIEILCLVLAALVLVCTQTALRTPWAAALLLSVFAAAIVAFSSSRFFPGRPRLRLAVESWSMLLFVTGVVWRSGGSASPVLNLYLLPLIVSALTLGTTATLLQVAAVGVCHALLALGTPGVELLSADYAAHAVGQIAPILIIAYLASTLSADVTEARERIENLAQTDPLTGLYNVRAFNEAWSGVHAAAQARTGPYAVLMIDVDQLRRINEGFGHDAGNSALTLVAECLRRSIRGSDCAARLGGDEFAVLLPGATPEVAEAVVKRIRSIVYKTTLNLRSRMIRCTVSVGVANYPRDAREMRDILGAAERNMYRDKELRRAPAVPVIA